MPQLGETVTEGTITRWMKAVGDQVDRDEPLFEVSTDKVDSEVPSPAAGVLSEILVPEGETVEVGVRLAVIGDGARLRPQASDGAGRRDRRRRPLRRSPGRGTAAAAATAAATPSARAGPAAPALPSRQPTPRRDGRKPTVPGAQVLSPMVRRILSENGIDASEVAGTGAGGRITRDDVLRRPTRVVPPPQHQHHRRPLPHHHPPLRPPRRRSAASGSGPRTSTRRAGRAASPASTRPGRGRGAPGPRGAARSGGLHGAVPHRRRPGRAVLQHAAPHRRAHGAVEGDVAARVHRQRGRLRGRRARAHGAGASASRRRRASRSRTSRSWRELRSRRCATSRS